MIDELQMEKRIETILEISRRVFFELGGGYSETVYESAMMVDFRKEGVPYKLRPDVDILYQGERVGFQQVDFLLWGDIAVEIGVGGIITMDHISRMTTCFKSHDVIRRAIIVNFPYSNNREDGIRHMVIPG